MRLAGKAAIMPDMDLVIFVGLQAAGKSSFYRTHFAATHVLVSKDVLRNNRHPEHRQRILIAEALAAGHSVVVDNTNPTIAERAALIALGRDAGATITGYYFPTTTQEAREHNRQREGRARVPDVAIYATAKRLEVPSYAEGFDRLYWVRIVGDGVFAVEAISQ